MALIKCTECENDVSDKANACPRCGAPIQNSIEFEDCRRKNEFDSTHTQKTKKRGFGRNVIITIVIVLLVGVFFILKNNPNSIPGFRIEVNTPNPIVVTSRADNSKSGLLKARTTVYATVQNQGGDGKVLVTFHIYQENKDYNRSKSIYLRASESQNLEETFNEVRYLGGEIKYDVVVE